MWGFCLSKYLKKQMLHLLPTAAFDLDKSEKASDLFFPVGKTLQLLQLILDFTPKVGSATIWGKATKVTCSFSPESFLILYPFFHNKKKKVLREILITCLKKKLFKLLYKLHKPLRDFKSILFACLKAQHSFSEMKMAGHSRRGPEEPEYSINFAFFLPLNSEQI